jgi:hypothetical protein
MSPFDWDKHRPGANGERFKIEVGDVLDGKIAKLGEKPSRYEGRVDPVLEIEQDDGKTVTWFASAASARAGLAEINAQVGDVIRVKRLPDVRAENDRMAHAYEITKGQHADGEWSFE